MNRMNRGIGRILSYVVGLVTVFSLAACSMDGYRKQVSKEYYLLDIEKGKLCLEQRSECYSLSLIGPSHRELIIADAFNLPKKAHRWDGQKLIQLLIEPPSAEYSVQVLNEKLYRLPPHYAVHSVWDVLALEYYELYEKGDDHFEMLPTPRRY